MRARAASDGEGPRRIEVHLPLHLMSVNEMLRSSEHRRADARDLLCGHLARELARTGQRPRVPFEYCEISITLHVPLPLDVDGKYAACKHLLDCLIRPKSGRELVRQQARQRRALFIPLGVIRDDTDGEHGMGGCVRRFTVRQEFAARPAFTLIVQEVGA